MATGLGGEQLWISPTVANNVNPYDDQSGQGNNGTNNGSTVVSDTSSGGSYAFNFDGVNDYIDISGFAANTSAYSVSCWIDGTGPNQTIVAFNSGDSSGGRATNIGLQPSGTALAGHQNGGSSYWAESTSSVNGSGWKHVTYTFDGSTVEIFIDGVSEDTQAASATNKTQALAYIGRGVGPTPFWLTGKMDDIRAYDRTITQSEITHLASQRGIEGPPPVGLGDETLWLCPSLNQSSPTSEISGAGLTITEEAAAGGTISIVTDTGAGGTHSVEFANSPSNCLLAIDNFGNTYSEVTSVSWWSRRTAGSVVRQIGLDTDLWPAVSSGRFFYETFNGADRAYMYNTSGGTNGWIDETGSNSTWKHHVMVREGVGGKNRLYINGVLDTQEYDDGGAESTGKDMYFGICGGSSPSSVLFVDDIRTYGRVLTQAEITHLATSRGVLGPPGGASFYNPFINETFENKSFRNPRF